MRIDTQEQLVTLLNALFEKVGINLEQVSKLGHYGMMFSVPGKLKPLIATLKTVTPPTNWNNETNVGYYKSADENWLLCLKPAPHSVFCIATVCSLHEKHLEQYIETPQKKQDRRIAAEHGDPEAQYYTAQDCEDKTEALFWYRKAGEQNHYWALYEIALMYEAGEGGLEKDFAQAILWRGKAAEQGCDAAARDLAEMYEEGTADIPQDLTLAIFWYERWLEFSPVMRRIIKPKIKSLKAALSQRMNE